MPGPNALSACTDDAYRLTNRRWRVGMSGTFNASTPSGVDPARAEVLFRRTPSNTVTATAAARGQDQRDERQPRRRDDCISDLKSVVGFRSVGDEFKAAPCWRATADVEPIEADISFHPSVTWTLADSIPRAASPRSTSRPSPPTSSATPSVSITRDRATPRSRCSRAPPATAARSPWASATCAATRRSTDLAIGSR
jgi:hypothetical protein